jgi:polyisoprenyl-phosphate glycosyltransferase
MKYSVIIPIYNEDQIIPELYRRMKTVIDSINGEAEVIFVDDNSSDNSFALIESINKSDNRFKLIRLARNFGHQVAITAGMEFSSGNAVVLMDGDLQDPPELLPSLIKKWEEGFQVVYTIKKSRKENVLKRFAFASFYKMMHTFSSISIPMEAGNFSLMDRRVVDVIRSMPERNRYISGMRAWAGFKQTGVEFDREARFAGKPKMSFRKLVDLALDGLISFSNAPLRLAIYVGLAVALLSFLGGLFVIYEKLFTDKAILGWTSTIVAITFIGSMVLLTLGVIGEYIGRIYDEVKHRPIYVIKDKVGV